jgi:hypothetical protein
MRTDPSIAASPVSTSDGNLSTCLTLPQHMLASLCLDAVGHAFDLEAAVATTTTMRPW